MNATNFKRLAEIQAIAPELTFNNNGYEYISLEVREKYKNIIIEIENILKGEIDGFVNFNNFKPLKNGNIDIRCQYKWDERFTGVGYFEFIKKTETETKYINKL